MEDNVIGSIAAAARLIRELDDKISELNASVERLKDERQVHKEEIIKRMESLSSDSPEPLTALSIDGVGLVKLSTTPRPRILDIDKFMSWCDGKQIMHPALSVNARTMESWWKEQNKLNLPLPPEDVVSVYFTTDVRVNKS